MGMFLGSLSFLSFSQFVYFYMNTTLIIVVL